MSRPPRTVAMLGLAALVLTSRLASAEGAHIFIGVGGTLRDLQWVEKQRSLHGVAYTPVMINPNPLVRDPRDLGEVVQSLGGTYYPNAAWTADGVNLHLSMSPLEVYKGGLDSIFHVRGRHSQRVNVTSVDLARIMKEHTSPGDVVVMRMDVEGAEYELLRHLMLQGVICRLTRLFLETHAMSNPALNSMRNFDVLLPWLVAPCGTEVFVDSNYHSVWESKAMWPKLDGACLFCPALYTTLPGAGAARCPSSALPQCFDEEFTCERCCNLRLGPRGDTKCWTRSSGSGKQAKAPQAKKLPTGGRAYTLPSQVMDKLESEAKTASWKQRIIDDVRSTDRSPQVFSYEMCCAGMLGLLSTDLMALIGDREQHEAFSPENDKYSLPAGSASSLVAGSPACPDVAGPYSDSGGGTVMVTQSGCEVTAANMFQKWSVTGTVTQTEARLESWNLVGSLDRTGSAIYWSNGAFWKRSS